MQARSRRGLREFHSGGGHPGRTLNEAFHPDHPQMLGLIDLDGRGEVGIQGCGFVDRDEFTVLLLQDRVAFRRRRWCGGYLRRELVRLDGDFLPREKMVNFPGLS